MGETKETPIFTGDSEGSGAKLSKSVGLFLAPPSSKPPASPK